MRPIEPLSIDEWKQKIEGGHFRLTHYENQSQLSTLDHGITPGPFRRADIARLVWCVEGSGDGLPWVAILQLTDGRWVYFTHEVRITDYTDRWTYVFAADRGRLWWWACTDEDRERLATRFTADERADEMVQLDIMLQSDDARMRELAETRRARVALSELADRRRGP